MGTREGQVSNGWAPPFGLLPAALLMIVGTLATSLEGQSLRGSEESVARQAREASEHDFTYLRDPAQVRRFVAAGLLFPVRGSDNSDLDGASFPYARPEVATFIDRISKQYRTACGEELVVTSLTRPLSAQPSNASPRSVHPTGMAVDFRRSGRRACRNWLEETLLTLEGRGVLEATSERRPPHYHVAIFPQPYTEYVVAMASPQEPQAGPSEMESTESPYQVQPGDNLWTIAHAHSTTVEALTLANDLRGSRIYPGQELDLPNGSSGTVAYRVQRGDSLWSIAQRHATSVQQLQAANELRTDRIIEGQVLLVPFES